MQDLTSGPVARHLVTTTGFMLVTMVFQTLYFLIDLYWVGHLGKEAVAAVAIAGNLTFVVLAMTQMLAVGTTTLVSHAAGRKDVPQALYVFNQALGLSVVVGVLFYAVATLARGFYTDNLSADRATAALAEEYLRWFIPAMALQFGIVAMSAALRGTGNFKPGMVIQTATVILNMILAPFLIFGWLSGRPLGVAGAAISSLVAIGVGTVWMLAYFLPASSFLKFVPRDWVPNPKTWGRLLSIGLPAGLEFALMAVHLFIIYAVIRRFGAAAQAGFGIGLRLVQAGFMPVVALGFSVAPLAGQNFGAGLMDRVRDTFRSAASLAAAAMLVLTAICQLAPAWLIQRFSSDPHVIRVGAEYLRIVSWSFVGSGLVYVSSSMFQALGNTLPALVSSTVRLVVVSVPLILMSRLPGFELRWAWYLGMASVMLQMGLSLLLLQREFRRRLIAALETAPVA
jgi:putative MATE family efflux protein